MQNSKIEWTDSTFNPWWGCEKVSAGCKNCYAETLDNRLHEGRNWGPGSSRKKMSVQYWNQLQRWDREAQKKGIKSKVFVASMADIFEDHPDVVEERKKLFAYVHGCINLTFQLLTKRPENILPLIPNSWKVFGWPENVWMGTSVENQEAADKRIPVLEACGAKIKFLSVEPMLGPVNIINYKSIDWVICGGKSGPGAREIWVSWVEDLQDQCETSHIPFFFKQWGGVNKKDTGRLLHGKEYSQFPK